MSTNKKILVVDDEASLVDLCQLILSTAGYQVRGANSGKDALNLIDEEMPDLVLLDVMMPGMNGIEVCRRIRETAEAESPYIIMFTADERESTRKDSMAAGANALLTKDTAIVDLPTKLSPYLTA
ncbi:MAG TPA: response regulator [Anaerolineae bacterium]|nr:response regulator [Anaerolineae bacterium]